MPPPFIQKVFNLKISNLKIPNLKISNHKNRNPENQTSDPSSTNRCHRNVIVPSAQRIVKYRHLSAALNEQRWNNAPWHRGFFRSSDRNRHQRPCKSNRYRLSTRHRVDRNNVSSTGAWSPINATRPCVCLLDIGLRYRYRIIRRLESIPVEKTRLTSPFSGGDREGWRERGDGGGFVVVGNWSDPFAPVFAKIDCSGVNLRILIFANIKLREGRWKTFVAILCGCSFYVGHLVAFNIEEFQ